MQSDHRLYNRPDHTRFLRRPIPCYLGGELARPPPAPTPIDVPRWHKLRRGMLLGIRSFFRERRGPPRIDDRWPDAL